MEEPTGRRLPVYLLLDCSGSMMGEPIESVRQGLRALVSDLRGDPMALETVYLSIITIGSDAQQVCPLTDIAVFQEPTLEAAGATSIGAALRLLEERIRTEVRKSSPTQKGDWKPLVILMTDGRPTDVWEEVADRVKQKRIANIIACAAGSGADTTMLKRITDTVVELSGLQPDTFKSFFRWVSTSVAMISRAVGASPSQQMGDPPPPPPSITIVP